MGIWDVLLARPRGLDEAEEALGRPDVREAADLPFHIERCARRWDLSYRASKYNGAQIERLYWLVIVCAALILFKDTSLAQRLLAFL